MSKDNRPDLDITVEIEAPDGTHTLNANDRNPGNRPQGISWQTKLGEGFSGAGYSLSRDVAEDYPDLNLVDTTRFINADGDVLYQGYQAGQPRDLDSMHSIGVTLVGPVVDAKRRKFRELYVDRGPTRWGEPPLDRKVNIATGSVGMGRISASATGTGLSWAPPNESITAETAELWYIVPPGTNAQRFWYQGTRTGASWASFEAATLYAFDDPAGSSTENYALTLDDAGRSINFTAVRPALMLRVKTTGTVTPAAGHLQEISRVAVYGDHDVALYEPLTPSDPFGVRVTDVFEDIVARFCPGLDPSGIASSDFVIPHCAYIDRTWPYDALLDLNKYLLWKFCVWEDGLVVFEPHDLTDYTWQIRTDDPNVTFNWVGPTTENLANGVAVTYTDLLTGRPGEITPDDNAVLLDTNPDNPFTKAGRDQWYEIDISTPQLEEGATLMGMAALAEYNRPKAPGTFTIRGHIRDREGHWTPVANVRAGQTIAITNHPNDAPRLIVETDYQHDTQTLRVSVDSPFNLLEAQIDRLNVELEAAGLSR